MGNTSGVWLSRCWGLARRLWLALVLVWVVGSDGQDLGPLLRLKVGLHQPRGVRERVDPTDATGPFLPVEDAQWGPLRGSYQFLVSVVPPMNQDKIQRIKVAIEQNAGLVVAYLPDHVYLAVGPVSAAEAARGVGGVDWVGPYLPEYKVAPEWGDFLTAMGDNNTLAHILSGGMLNFTVRDMVSGDPIGESLGALHIDLAGQQRRVVIEVQFPPLMGSQIAEDRSVVPFKPGQAALADWAADMHEQFGSHIDLQAEHGTLQVVVPPELLPEVLQVLSAQPVVHWLQPRALSRLHNWRASSIIQSGKRAPDESLDVSFDLRPIWAAGILGEGQVVGVGDSGIDMDNCYFFDPAVPFSGSIQTEPRSNTRFFEDQSHRKVVYYRAETDFTDNGGHGTHVVGSLCGNPNDPSRAGNRGMAPLAKVAFIDLGGDDSGNVLTPRELSRFYYPNTYSRGAMVHSDSWGSDTVTYDVLSFEVDKFSFEHQKFLPVLAAGNFGEYARGTHTTVTAPATAKNCLAVGSTLTSGQRSFSRLEGVTAWETIVSVERSSGAESRRYKILEAFFGGSWRGLRDSDRDYRLLAGSPRLACSALTNNISDSIVLIERGDCKFSEKLRMAQDAGAVGVIITNNANSGYFIMEANDEFVGDLTIPMGSVPQSIGRELWPLLLSGQVVTVKIESKTDPQNTFDNIAEYSSSGPTRDGRFKPDIVAPGITLSSWSDGEFSNVQQCDEQIMSGTSISAPIVAGGALLAREYFMAGFYPSGKAVADDAHEPSGALVKATLLGGAFPMDGFTEAGLPLAPPPSPRQGFGRIHLERSLPVQGSALWEDGWRIQAVDSAKLAVGQVHEYCVKATGGPIRFTLVWTDPPASLSSDVALVNDLDLSVRAAGLDGEVLLGNGVEDRANNVEQVWIDNLPEGNVAIMVKGHNVPIHSPQPYALVVHGMFTGILQSPNNPAAETDVTSGVCVIVVAIITEGPQGPTSDSTPKFEFSTETGSPALNGFECQLVQPSNEAQIDALHNWEPCTSGKTYAELPDLPYKFSVRPTGEDIVATRDFVVDTTPPVTQILGDPIASQSSQERVSFVFTAKDATAVQFLCRLNFDGPGQHMLWRQDGEDIILGEWLPCISPQMYNGLSFGQWSFEVMGKDDVGNVESAAVSLSWDILFNEGQLYARTTSGPPAIVPSGAVEFQLSVLQGEGDSNPVVLLDSALECSLAKQANDGSTPSPEWETCSSVQTYEALEDGSFLFQARTVDPNGHSSESTSQTLFSVDSTSPTLTINRQPQRYHGASAASFFFDADEEVKGFNCSLTAVGEDPKFKSCAGPERGSAEYDVQDGEYAFVVLATDLVGNEGLSDQVEFMVDTAVPVVTIDYKNATSSNNISFSFEVFDEGSGVLPANVSCLLRNSGGQVDSEWLQNCTSPAAYTLSEGKYIFNVRAVDRARLQNELRDYVVAVDQTPPVSSISKGPAEGQVLPARVSFSFDAEDPSAEIASQVASSECHLSFVQPLAPEASKNDGGDDNGFKVDSGNEANKLMSTSQSDAIKKGDVSISILDGPTFSLGDWVQCGSPVTFQRMPSGQYEFRTRATDHAGNRGNATEAFLFEVDASLPIPGEGDSRSATPTWMWIVIVSSVAGALLMVLIAVGRCRRKARQTQQQRPGYQYYANGSSPGGAHEVPNGAMSAAMAASVQQQSIDAQNRALEERRLAAALAASKEEYNLQQALKQSMQGQPATAPPPAPVDAQGDDLQRAIALSLAESASAPPPPRQWP